MRVTGSQISLKSRFTGAMLAILLALAGVLAVSSPAAADPGTPDMAFYNATSGGLGGTAYTVAVVEANEDVDYDRIIVGGSFTTASGQTVGRIAAYKLDGTYDPTFTTNLGTGFGGGAVYSIAVQRDGKIVVGGQFTTLNGGSRQYLARLFTTGAPDPTFNTNIGSGPSGIVEKVMVQPNGMTDNVIVGGRFSQFNGTGAGRLARVDYTGTFDTTFNTNIGTGANDYVHGLTQQTDGSLIVAGEFTGFGGNVVGAIVRLSSAGVYDPTFTTNTGTGFGNDVVFAVAAQTDDKVLAVGDFSDVNSIVSNNIARLDSNGTPDAAFSGNLGSGGDYEAYDVYQQSDGKIVMVGDFDYDTLGNGGQWLAVLASDGTPDQAFANELGSGINNTVQSAAEAPGGQVLAVGAFSAINGVPISRFIQLGTTDLSFDPAPLDFGTVRVDSTDTKTVTVTNDGPFPAIFKTGAVTLSGTNPGMFEVVTDNCSDTTVDVGNTCTVDVKFSPAAVADYSADLEFADNATGTPQKVALAGSGIAPEFNADPNPVDFGTQKVNTTSPVTTVTVTNTGNDNLVFESPALNLSGANPGQFTVDTTDCDGATLAPPPSSDSCTVDLTFTPTSAGPKTASLDFYDDAPDSPQSVPLSGTGGLPVFSASPDPVAFGNQAPGTSSSWQTVTVENTGDATLVFGANAVTITGANSGQFATQNDTCSNQTLNPTAPGNTCTVQVRFSPSSLGSKTANLRFNSADLDPQLVPLSGTGAVPAPTGFKAFAGKWMIQTTWNPVAVATSYEVTLASTPRGGKTTTKIQRTTSEFYTWKVILAPGTRYTACTRSVNSYGKSTATCATGTVPTWKTAGAVKGALLKD